jgi:phage-related protein
VKPAKFHPKAKAEIKEFPEDIRRELGKAIFDLQKGSKFGMPLSKAMPSVGIGVEELRLKDRNGIYRVFYYLKFRNAVLIFHAFQKKTQKTPPHEIEVGKKRLQELLQDEKE